MVRIGKPKHVHPLIRDGTLEMLASKRTTLADFKEEV